MSAHHIVFQALNELTLPPPDKLDFTSVVKMYQALRPVLPEAVAGPCLIRDRLIDILDDVDALILDGFGVINVGLDKIEGIDELLDEAARKGKIVVVLTNGASHPAAVTAQKYAGWGLDLPQGHIVSSRDVLVRTALTHLARRRFISFADTTTPLGLAGELRTGSDTQPWAQAEEAVLLGAGNWSEEGQAQLEIFLNQKQAPLYVANPDISAPYSNGFSTEPGYWAVRAMKAAQILPRWCGKPHPDAFRLAVQRVNQLAGGTVARDRIVMVGDTPHTDILGGQAFGLKTALITSYGFLRDQNTARILSDIGITPTWQLARL